MDLPIYKLSIDDENETGVTYMALVDKPAIMVNWQAFSDQKQYFSDEQKRIISGPAMIPDMPIFRRTQEFGEHYVVFDANTIEKIVAKFFRMNRVNNVNAMHKEGVDLAGVFMVESYFLDPERGKSVPKNFSEELPTGTWWTSYKVDDQKVWDDFISTGKFRGFSVEGLFEYPPATEEDALIQEILSAINGK